MFFKVGKFNSYTGLYGDYSSRSADMLPDLSSNTKRMIGTLNDPMIWGIKPLVENNTVRFLDGSKAVEEPDSDYTVGTKVVEGIKLINIYPETNCPRDYAAAFIAIKLEEGKTYELSTWVRVSADSRSILWLYDNKAAYYKYGMPVYSSSFTNEGVDRSYPKVHVKDGIAITEYVASINVTQYKDATSTSQDNILIQNTTSNKLSNRLKIINSKPAIKEYPEIDESRICYTLQFVPKHTGVYVVALGCINAINADYNAATNRPGLNTRKEERFILCNPAPAKMTGYDLSVFYKEIGEY